MDDENLLGGRFEELTLLQAEQSFQEAMALVGLAKQDIRDRLNNGEPPEAVDIQALSKELGLAWIALQKERDRIAEFRRKRGELVEGDLDFTAARVAISEQLDRIAASLEEE